MWIGSLRKLDKGTLLEIVNEDLRKIKANGDTVAVFGEKDYLTIEGYNWLELEDLFIEKNLYFIVSRYEFVDKAEYEEMKRTGTLTSEDNEHMVYIFNRHSEIRWANEVAMFAPNSRIQYLMKYFALYDNDKPQKKKTKMVSTSRDINKKLKYEDLCALPMEEALQIVNEDLQRIKEKGETILVFGERDYLIVQSSWAQVIDYFEDIYLHGNMYYFDKKNYEIVLDDEEPMFTTRARLKNKAEAFLKEERRQIRKERKERKELERQRKMKLAAHEDEN